MGERGTPAYDWVTVYSQPGEYQRSRVNDLFNKQTQDISLINRMALTPGRLALMKPEAWLSKTGTVA
jgi:hypothetical protein